MDKFFLWWVVSFLIEIVFFTLNPSLGIFLAIVMIPIMIHDLLIKLFFENTIKVKVVEKIK